MKRALRFNEISRAFVEYSGDWRGANVWLINTFHTHTHIHIHARSHFPTDIGQTIFCHNEFRKSINESETANLVEL